MCQSGAGGVRFKDSHEFAVEPFPQRAWKAAHVDPPAASQHQPRLCSPCTNSVCELRERAGGLFKKQLQIPSGHRDRPAPSTVL